MALQEGSTVGAYRVSGLLGKGGMGEVWRALDTNLDREVALKALPEEVAGNAERLSRFEREAKVLASLNHQNIATLYNLDRLEGQHVLVMELVEGQDLDVLIDGGGLDLERAVEIAMQIAEALEAAHAQGIVHRDLKPANIKIRPDGTVKVLDFGLAKAWSSNDEDGGSQSLSPTLTRHATVEGVILGTAAYMSPEQARGHTVDKRADIWAFGVVVWQMLTGRRLFDGDTVSDTLAAVLKEEPDMDLLPPATPPSIRRLLRRCLQKDPKQRLHDIADARLELSDEDEEKPALEEGRPSATSSPVVRALPWIVALVAAAIALAAWLGPRPSEQKPQRLVAKIPPPAGTEFLASRGLAVSPDGSMIVFGATEEAGDSALWLQSLEHGTVRRLAGTKGGLRPFWAPDGSAIGFFADSQLKTLTLESGVVEELAEVSGRPSGSWSPRGVIVATRFYGMFQVPAAGGETSSLEPSDSEELEFLSPSFLPDGTHFIYLKRSYSSTDAMHALAIGSTEGGPHKVLMPSNSNAVYAPSGELVWWQGGHLRAQPFDLERLEMTGDSRVLQPDVRFDPRTGMAMFSVASNGTLAYRSGGLIAGDELAIVARDGSELGAVGEPGNFYHPRLSPDGTTVAVDRSDESNRGDIWLYDMARGSGTRFTSAPQDESIPVWSPDGRRLAFVSNRVTPEGAVHVRSLRGGDDEEVLYQNASAPASPWSWSSDDLIVIQYTGDQGDLRGDLGIYSMADQTFTPHISTNFVELHGVISPDGRLLAYSSNETGRSEIYVETFPDQTDRWRISTNGGMGPSWSGDGRELYFAKDFTHLMAVAVERSNGNSVFRFGEPERLFTTTFKYGAASRQPYDTLDGQTFIINRSIADHDTSPLTLVVNALPR